VRRCVVRLVRDVRACLIRDEQFRPQNNNYKTSFVPGTRFNFGFDHPVLRAEIRIGFKRFKDFKPIDKSPAHALPFRGRVLVTIAVGAIHEKQREHRVVNEVGAASRQQMQLNCKCRGMQCIQLQLKFVRKSYFC
jgi:hypothetical protein